MVPLLLLACAHDVPPERVSVEVDEEIPTLVHVRWSTAEPVLTEVVVTLPGDPAVTTPVSTAPTTTHSIDLHPLPAGTPAVLLLRDLDTDGAEVGRSTHTLELPAAPYTLAEVSEVLVPEAPPTPYLLLASVTAADGNASVQVVDWHGRPVWWMEPDNTYAGFARLRQDGNGIFVVTNWTPEGASSAGAVGRIDWGGAQALWPAPQIHHDVLELPDGRVGVAGWVNEQVDGVEIAGERLMIVGPDGPETTVWNAFDHLEVTESRCWDFPAVNGGGVDWIHLNGLAYAPDTDLWLLSLYCQESVLAVRGATGETEWSVGGEVGQLTLVDGAGFGPQHAPRWMPGGFRLFDNGMDVSLGSRSVQFAVDTFTGTVSEVADWHPPDLSYTGVLGESNDYGDGGQIVGFGFDGSVFWHDADGVVQGELLVEAGETVGSVEGVPALPLDSTTATE